MVTMQAQIDALHKQIRSIRFSDYRRVLELAQQMYDLAQIQDDTAGVIRSLNHLAWGYNRLGQYNRSVSPAKEAYRLANEHQLPIETGYALCNLTACYHQTGQMDDAIDAIKEQLRIAEAHQDEELNVMGLNDLGALYLRQGDDKYAERLFNQCIERIHGTDFPLTYPLYNLATVSMIREDYMRAADCIGKAVSDAQQHTDVNMQVSTLELMAEICIQRDQLEDANSTILAALNLIEEHDLSPIYSLHIQAQIHQLQGDYAIAETILQRAAQVAQENDDYQGAMLIYGALAENYEIREDFEQAYRYLRRQVEAQAHRAEENATNRTQILKTIFEVEALEYQLEEQKRSVADRVARERIQFELVKQEEFNAIKQRVLSRLSHEFRTPLAVLRTSIDLIMRYGHRMDDEKRQYHRAKVGEHFQAIEYLLDDTLAVLRSIGHERQLEAQTVLLGEVFQHIINELDRDERVNFKLDSPGIVVSSHEPTLGQIVRHMLANALKFSEGAVQFDVSIDAEAVRLTVTDHGIGIPDDEQKRVFEPLVRGSNAEHVPGNGLGLTIIKNYAELLGGIVHLNSTLGSGTTLTVTLPREMNS
jgi:signal transduction histidine kinase